VETLNEAIEVLGGADIQPMQVNTREEFAANLDNYDVDFPMCGARKTSNARSNWRQRAATTSS
jgi:hypothetical protein